MESNIQCISNNEYTYVITSNDISIFEVEEWENLLQISKVFEGAVTDISDESDYGYGYIDDTLKSYAHYLYYSPFCHYSNFSSLEWGTTTLDDVYNRQFREKLTVHEFRKWISKNYKEINEKCDYIKSCDSISKL